MTHLNRILSMLALALVLIGAAGPALADPATMIIAGLASSGITVSATAAFAIRIGVGLAFSALSTALMSGTANANGAPKGITLRSTTAGEQIPQSFILGHYVTAGNLAAPEMSHGVNGDTRYLTRVIDLSDVPVDGLESLIIDGVACTLATGAPATLTMTQGDGTTPAIHPDYGPTVNKGDFIGFAWCRFRDGSQTTADPMLLAKYTSYPQRPWTSAMVGRGVAQAILTFLWRDSPQVWQGRPDVRFVVKGIRLYDPRKDSTAGGSGAHRYATVSTHEWSENPVVMIYNLLRGIQIPGGPVFGGGFTAANLPCATWAAAMNACDVMVGTRKTYVAGLEVVMGGADAGGQSPADVIEELLKACSGQIADVGGTLTIRVGAPGLPVKFITDDDILVSQAQELDPFPGAQDSYNIVHATWMSPGNLWTPKEATPRRDEDAITADGQELPAPLSLPAVTVAGQVQQLMTGWLKDAQRHRRQSITLPPDGILLKPLDVIDWTSPRNGYAGKDFEIGQVGIDPMTLCTTLALREVDPDDYDWAAGDDIAVTAPSVEPVIPGPVTVPGFTATATTIKDGSGADRLPAIRLGWTLPLAGVSAVRFQIRVSGSNTVAVEGSTANVDVGYHVVSAGIVGNVPYQARARLVGPKTTEWTAWVTVTAPDVGITGADFQGSIEEVFRNAGLAPVEIVTTLPTTGNFEGRTVYLTTDNKLYRWTGTAWTAAVETVDLVGQIVAEQVASGAITTAKFATGLAPVEIVSSLPTSGNFAGRTVFLTTDGKLYRHTGSPTGSAGFTAAVPAVDVTGQLTDAQIAAVAAAKLTGQITAPQIAASAVTAEKIAAQAVTTAKFASGIAPVEIVAALPTTGNFEGRTVYLTTDDKLYRHTGSPTGSAGFTAAVPAADVTGQLTNAQIADIAAAKLTGQITAPQIADGAVTDAKIAGMAAAKVTGQLTNAQIADVAAAKLTGQITAPQIAASAVTADKIAAQAVTTAKFASGIAPVEIVTALPTTGNFEGRTVYLTTDDRLYRHTGSPTGSAGFTAAVPAADVTGQLTNAQIADIAAAKLTGQITAPQIADGAVTDAKIAGIAAAKVIGQLTNAQIADVAAAKLTGQITTTQITDNAVTSPKVTAGAVTTAKLAAGAVTADTIAASAVTAAKLAAGSVEAAAIAAGAVQADKIAAGAVTAAKVAADAIDATKIAAGSITSVALASGAVTTAKLAAGAVTADTIAADAVTAAKIAAGAVTASEIAAGAVTADKVAANAITAGKIAAGAVSATEIAAGAITSAKVLVGNPDNLVPNPDFATGTLASWYPWSGAAFISVVAATAAGVPAGAPALNVCKFTATGGTVALFSHESVYTADGDGIAVTPGDTFLATIDVAAEADVTAPLHLIAWYRTTARTNTTATFACTPVAGTWMRYSFNITVPANVYKMHMYVRWNLSAGGPLCFTNLRVIRRNTGELIVDGAISANKIVAGAVTADKIAVNAIDASKIAAGSITSVSLASGAVTTATLAAGAVTADAIAANAVTAAKLAAGSVEAAAIAAGAVQADKIAAGAVTAAKVAADAIDATKIAAGSITSVALASGAVTTAKLAAGAVTADTIAADAVTAAKIAANAVTASEIAAGAVTADKVAANAITAGKIAAGAVSATEIAAGAVTTEKLAVGSGLNTVHNAQFYGGLSGWHATAVSGNTGVMSLRSGTSWSKPGGPVLQVYQPDAGTAGYVDVRPERVGETGNARFGWPVREGEAWEASAGISAHRCTVNVRIEWRDLAGTTLGYTAAASNAANPYSSTDPDLWPRLVSRGTAPTGAAYAVLHLRKNPTSSGADSYMLVYKPLLGPTVAQATEPLPWSPGGYTLVTGDTILTGSIQAANIAANAIDATKIAAGAITAVELASGAVTTAKLAAGAVTADTIAADAVTTAKIAAGAVTATEIAAGAVTATKIAADTITAGQIAAGAISASEIAAGAVNADKLAAGAVTADKIAANAVTAGKIAADAVTADKIAANAVTSQAIAANAITAGLIAAGAITTSDLIVDGAVSRRVYARGSNVTLTTGLQVIVSKTFGSGSFSAFQGTAGSRSNPILLSLDFDIVIYAGETGWHTLTLQAGLNVSGTWQSDFLLQTFRVPLDAGFGTIQYTKAFVIDSGSWATAAAMRVRMMKAATPARIDASGDYMLTQISV